MRWDVEISRKALKGLSKMPSQVRKQLFLLMKGKPTYVAVWEEQNKEIKLVEVIYAGTHEKAPY
jgi:mRNA-degrading endonuclease RelE of RelBE toxin-antitoxin system